ncbi:MAG: (Fe-S)-binding protein [Candidatus Lokiarchaeota archaeon]|nr:(Fe-S)-binding protein [Candidatus Lokiarchaeota archaeon]
MKERIKGRNNYPTKEIDPINFLSDKKVKEIALNLKDLKFTQKDFNKLYDCVHCGECPTEKQRIQLKQQFLKQGNIFDGWKDMVKNFKEYRTPYPTNQMRIDIPEGISENSETLLFMGCLSTIRIPRYTEHALKYLLKQDIDFTILDKEICCGWPWYVSGSIEELEICIQENIEIFENYKKIICLCPACYHLFRNNYEEKFKKRIKIIYISDYLKPSKEKKKGNIAFQHLCQLMYRGRESVDKYIENIFRESGYNIIDIPHWCCGHGLGRMHRIDIIDKIGEKRINDFNQENIDYVSTYCVSCWSWLYRFGKKYRIKPQIRDVFELLL